MNQLIDQIESINGLRNTFMEWVNECKETIKDGTFSVEDRWELYLAISPLLDDNSWVWHPKCLERYGNFTWYDSFGVDRYQTEILDDEFIERAIEEFPDINVSELKEEIMKLGHRGFINDW